MKITDRRYGSNVNLGVCLNASPNPSLFLSILCRDSDTVVNSRSIILELTYIIIFNISSEWSHFSSSGGHPTIFRHLSSFACRPRQFRNSLGCSSQFWLDKFRRLHTRCSLYCIVAFLKVKHNSCARNFSVLWAGLASVYVCFPCKVFVEELSSLLNKAMLLGWMHLWVLQWIACVTEFYWFCWGIESLVIWLHYFSYYSNGGLFSHSLWIKLDSDIIGCPFLGALVTFINFT